MGDQTQPEKPRIASVGRSLSGSAPSVVVRDAVRVPEREWDSTSEEMRYPYREEYRKGGYVYGIREH